MGYSSADNKRPFERASKASHHHIINDPEVKSLMDRIFLPPGGENIVVESLTSPFEPISQNPVEAIIAVDGGYTEAVIDKNYPSRAIHFLQFGALLFRKEDLDKLNQTPFIAPEDMAKLKNIHRLKLALPTKNVRFKDEETLSGTVRKAIAEFFIKNSLDESQSLMDSLSWFVFRHYKQKERTEADREWKLSSNPLSSEGNPVLLKESEMDKDYTFPCPETGNRIWLTDIFRFHEIIDEELGAGGGLLAYLTNVIEHLIIIHIIRQLLSKQPAMLSKVLFIKDGATGFFGQTARLHQPMRELINWLFEKHNLLLVGLEKSGAFVDHARELQKRLKPSEILLLNNEYIYKYILPGKHDLNEAYGSTTNYGHKLIFKTRAGQMFVVSVPAKSIKPTPTIEDLPNLAVLLTNVEALRCDMYDSALFPVALVNKLVSLSSHPSQRILQKFAISSIR